MDLDMDHPPLFSGNHCLKTGEPCDACQSLSTLDAEYAAARRVLVSRINEQHDPFILRLPVELASRILTLCLPYPASLHAFSTLEDEEDEGYDPPIPFLLASVSAQWRRIALATPQLWNIISLNFEEGCRAAPKFVINEWIRRSGILPLYIRVFCAEERDSDQSLAALINHLNRESHRWKVLELHLPGHLFARFHGSSAIPHPTNTLVRLKLCPVVEEYPDNAEDDLPISFRPQTQPSPKSLTISKMSLSMISIDWSRLTNFDATSITLGDCMRVMLYSPRLERCTLEEVERDFEENELPSSHIIHHNLSYLDVFHHNPRFLSFFTFRSLRELHFEAGNTPPRDIEAFLERSMILGTLNAFTISNCDYSSEFINSELHRLLRATPSLTRLAIIETPVTGGFFDLFASSTTVIDSSEIFLPRLRYLRIKGARDFEWSSIRTILPCSDQEGHAISHLALERLDLELRGGGLIDKPVLQEMLAARVNGLKLRVLDSQGRDLIRKSKLHYANLDGQT